ncbi:hypothetical protein E8E15_006753 [Penicillium rubens]|nr:hypothetical protein E8E15_006753 [Penicillium rubens]
MGYARPLEFTLSVVVRTNPSPLDFQFASDTLLLQWPVLNLRMDPLKTKFLDPKDPGDLTEVWEGKTLEQELSDIVSVSSEPDSPQLFDSAALDKALDFGYGMVHAWRQRVFSIRTVFLTDACIIGFKFLQPLCDANGAHQIVQAPPLSLKSEVLEKCAEKVESHQIADLHEHSMCRTWVAGIGALGKQIGRNICYPSARRISKTLLIPRRQIQSWLEEAESDKAKVTEHDLVAAFIYKASLHPPIAHSFGLAIDISNQVQSKATLYNPWYMMPVPDPIPTSEYNSPSLIRLATHIRRAIHEGQQPECIGEIVDQHKSPKNNPMIPKSYGGRAAQPRIASWKNLPLYDLDIQDVPSRYKTSLRSMSHPEGKMSTTEYNDVMRAMRPLKPDLPNDAESRETGAKATRRKKPIL